MLDKIHDIQRFATQFVNTLWDYEQLNDKTTDDATHLIVKMTMHLDKLITRFNKLHLLHIKNRENHKIE